MEFLCELRKGPLFSHCHHSQCTWTCPSVQYRELEEMSSGDISPQEGQSQEYNSDEKIEASTNSHSVSRMPVTQIMPAVNTPLQQAQHRANHQLSLGLCPYPQAQTARKPERLSHPFSNSLSVTLLCFISSSIGTQGTEQLLSSGRASGTEPVSVQLTGPSRWESAFPHSCGRLE